MISADQIAGARQEPDEGGRASFFRRLLRHPLGVASLLWVLLMVVLAIGAPVFAPHSALTTTLTETLRGPSAVHWLGTDEDGRDVLSRLMFGARPTLLAVLEAVAVTLAIGVPTGVASGFFGGRIDQFVRYVTDMTLSFPVIIMVFIVLGVFAGNMTVGMVALGIFLAPGLVRIIRADTLAIRSELYLDAARVAGLTSAQIMRRHVLPRIQGPIIVQASLFSAVSLVVAAGLAFLGIGVHPPNPTWGSMLEEGFAAIQQQPWLVVPTSGVIFLTCLAFGLMGDAMRDTATEGWIGNRSQVTRRKRSERTREGRSEWRQASVTSSPVPAVDQRVDSVRPLEGNEVPDARALLSVRRLSVTFPGEPDDVTVVESVSFDVLKGEVVGIVGESGSGKTSIARAIIGLVPSGGYISSGQVLFNGTNLVHLDRGRMRSVRGTGIAYVAQDPMAALDPTWSVGALLTESVRSHERISRARARDRAMELLELVQLPDPPRVMKSYPHELSGGMAQRVSIARSISGRPSLLIADEPTTALDVTIQSEILGLLRALQGETGMAILLITHDWGIVADIAQRAMVVYAGQVVESAPVRDLFRAPAHPYTQGLLGADPHRWPTAERLPAIRGVVPSPREWPIGCRFRERCSYAVDECAARPIGIERVGPTRTVRCIRREVTTADTMEPR